MRQKQMNTIKMIFLLAVNPKKLFKSKHGRQLLGQWSRAVRNRDGRCLKCGTQSELEAHHIYPKSIYPKLWLKLDNGMALCKSCHRIGHNSIHSFIPKKKMNEFTTIAFLKSK